MESDQEEILRATVEKAIYKKKLKELEKALNRQSIHFKLDGTLLMMRHLGKEWEELTNEKIGELLGEDSEFFEQEVIPEPETEVEDGLPREMQESTESQI